MWCLRAVVCLLFCYGYPADVAVGDKRPYFDSRNFYNVLRWDPIEPIQEQDPLHRGGQPVLYSVSYRRVEHEEPLLPKMECQNITRRSCDLTAETPTLPAVFYEAQVSANGSPVGKTYRFQPLANTFLGPPQLTTRVSGPSLHLNVTLPRGPGDTPLLELLNRSRCVTFDPVVSYSLKITKPSWAVQVNNSHTGRYVLNLKNNNTEYCGYVEYKPNFQGARPPSGNTTFCVLMLRDPWVEVPWFLVAAGLVTVPVVLSAVLVYLYVHPRKKPHLPPSMQVAGSSSAQPTFLFPSDQNPVFSVPVVWPLEMRKLTNKTFPIKQKPKALSLAPGGYSPQCDPCDHDDGDLAWEDSSCPSSAGGEEVNSSGRPPSECRSSAAQSSVSYAQVIFNVAVEGTSGPHPVVDIPSVYRVNDMPCEDRVIDREHGDEAVKTSPTMTSHMASLFVDLGDNPTGPLLLPAVRDPKGQLTLSMLAFQTQADGDEREEEEEKPLLVGAEYKAQVPSRLLLSLNSTAGSEDRDSGCGQSTANTTPTQLSIGSDGSPTGPAPPAGLWSSCSERDMMASGYKNNWFNGGENTCEYTFSHQPWTQAEEAGEGEEKEQGDGQVFLGGWVVQIQD